ncbi:MAG: protein kinase [Acidobacteria bacterium]|nr:protein kinase [Acidobacteriota bacterium]
MDPTSDRWNRLQSWFEQALELPESERAAFVASVPADDTLRAELEGMLRHAGPNRFHHILQTSVTALPLAATPDRFGPYKIVREVGRGGMGVVYEALRQGEFEQRVALKLAPQWRDATELHIRIRHERQILASLHHPNIARLLDGGSENGVPYFAMEFVDGVPLTVYARDRKLALRERILLFQQMLDGVQYAHSSMVVHRDLKPSNILVTETGTVKLLDFGIAKMLDLAVDNTGTGTALMLTPDYASPEQIRAKPVTAGSDVYALGLVLFELLTSTKAQPAATLAPLDLDRLVCETETPRASARALEQNDPKLARALAGDLDNVIAKATSKEPQRRYSSAADFHADLTRYLEGRPVLARESTFPYRAAKFIRRNRGAVAASVLLAAAVAAGVASTLHQARRAERRFQQVRALAHSFVFDVHDRIQSLPGSIPARQAIVSTALKYLENLREESGEDTALQIEIAEAYSRVAEVQGNPVVSNLGDRTGARKSYTNAIHLLEPLVRRNLPEARLPYVKVLSGLMQISQEAGDAKAAIGQLKQAGEQMELALSERPNDPSVLHAAAGFYPDYALFLHRMRDPSAREIARRAMQSARRLYALDPTNLDSGQQLAIAQRALANVALAAGDIEEAAAILRESVEIRENLVKANPANTDLRRILIVGYGHLSDTLGGRTGENLGDSTGAAHAMESALVHAQWLRASNTGDRRAIFDEISVRLRLGALRIDAGQPEAAIAELDLAAKDLHTLELPEPNNHRYRVTRAFIQRRLGEASAGLRRYPQAVRYLDDAVRLYSGITTGPEVATAELGRLLAMMHLARVLEASASTRARTAADALAADLDRKPKSLAPPWNKAKIFGELGLVYARLGETVQSAKWLHASSTIWSELKLPKALEPARQKELGTVRATLAGKTARH